MAETVTITTFLELKDNMSAGLGKVEAALKKIGGAQASQTKADKEQAKAKKEQEKAAERQAKIQQRAARFEEQAAKRRQREFDASAKKAQAASDRAMRDIQKKEAAKQIEARKTQAFISRSLLENQEKHRKAAAQQARIERNLAKAREREQRQIERSRLGPRFDPAARSQQQLRDMRRLEAERARAARAGARPTMFGPRYDPAARARQQMRAESQAARAAEIAARRRAAAEIRELRRVEAERNRAARAEQRRIRELSRAQAQAKREHSDFVGKAGAAMFGPSIGGIVAAFQKSPEVGLELGALALLEAGLIAVRKAATLAFDSIKSLIEKTFEVSSKYEISLRRIANTLQSMRISPGFFTSTQKATALYEQLRQKAAVLPGETQDYIDVFGLALPRALAQGERDLKKFADASAKFTAYAIQMGQLDMQQTGRDLARILQGRALQTTAMFQKIQQLPSLKLMLAADWNKLVPVERMRLFYAAMEDASAGFDDMKYSADAVMGTFKSLVDMIFFQRGGAPLFESSLRIVERINKLLQDNNQELTKSVNIINQRLGWALEGAAIKVTDLGTAAAKFTLELNDQHSIALGILNVFIQTSAVLKTAVMMARGLQSLASTGKKAAEATEREKEAERGAQAADVVTKAYGSKVGDVLGRITKAKGMRIERVRDFAFESIAKSEVLRQGGQRAFEAAFMRWGGLSSERTQELWEMATTPANIPDPEAMPTSRTGRVAPAARTTNINDFRFSKFDIRQEFAEGFDPDRIAVAFASDLAKLGEMRMQSSYAPLYAVMGG